MASRAAFGPRAVVWRPLIYIIVLNLHQEFVDFCKTPPVPWPCQGQRRSGLSDTRAEAVVPAPAYANGVWPLLQLASVA